MRRRTRIKRFFWHGTAIFLVLLAVAISVLRVMSGAIDEYLPRIENLASEYLGQPVRIAGIRARLDGFSPQLLLKDVSLLQHQNGPAMVQLASLAVSLDPMASLFRGDPILDLTLNGADLVILHQEDQRFTLQGFSSSTQSDTDGGSVTDSAGAALGTWLLGQTRLALSDSRVSFRPKGKKEAFVFENVELELRNDGDRHRLNASLRLPGKLGEELRIALDLQGDPLSDGTWQAQLYARARQVSAMPWREQLLWQGSAVQQGIVDAELWSQWKDGKLYSASGYFNASDLTIKRGESLHRAPRLSSRFSWERWTQGWGMELSQLHLTPKGKPLRLSLHHRQDEWLLQADRLPLQPLWGWLALLPQLDDKSRAMMSGVAADGELQALRIARTQGERLILQGRVEDFSMNDWQELPGINGLDASFRFAGESGEIKFLGKDVTLALPRLFREPLIIDELDGELQLWRYDQTWRLHSDALTLRNKDIALQLSTELLLIDGDRPWLALQGKFGDGDARTVPRYLPAGIMSEGSLNWLDNAFKSGRVPRGRMQYYGPLKGFPFREQQGRFEVLFDAEAVQLHYHDGWPDLQQVRGEVHFDDAGMFIEAESASLYQSNVGRTRVAIEDFHFPLLLINGSGALRLDDGLSFLRNSPLAEYGGDMLQTLQGRGDAELTLSLDIPLSAAAHQTHETRVKGELHLSEGELDVTEAVQLRALNGTLGFSEKQFVAQRIDANLFDRPVKMVVLSEGGSDSRVVIAARGRADVQQLQQKFNLPILSRLQGETEWQSSLVIPRQRGQSAQLLLHASLDEIRSDLPPPLHQQPQPGEYIGLQLQLGDEGDGEYRLQYAQRFGAVWKMAGEAEQRFLERVQVRLGENAPLMLPQWKQIELVGTADGVDLPAWQQLLADGIVQTDRESRANLPIHVNMNRLGLRVINRKQDKELDTEKTERLGEMPYVDFHVAQLEYEGTRIGKVRFVLQPMSDRMLMENVRIEGDDFFVDGSGSWTMKDGTELTYTLQAKSLERMMKQLGFVSVIREGNTHSSGRLRWAGSPLEVSLSRLNGELNLKVEEGSIVDAEPGAGRLLGVLSLQALPRRLFLDFSDLFGEGLSFSEISADMRINDGNAYTSNLTMESIPAKVLITGRTGLIDEDFDQQVVVVPELSDTVSVAGALALGPQAAAILMLLQKVFESEIDAATMTHYRLTGSWAEPKIERIEENMPKQPAAQ